MRSQRCLNWKKLILWLLCGLRGTSSLCGPQIKMILPGCEKNPSTRLDQETSTADKGKGKMLAEQSDDRNEPIGDESGFDFDLEDHKMMDSVTTQIEVKIEGGSRTITILVNHDLLKNTKYVVQAFGPFDSQGAK